jgi:GNAT superfamily N-acetyltransferase
MARIKPATVQDAEAMNRIARTLRLEGRDLQHAEEEGFFLYVGGVEDYRKTIRESAYCYSAFVDSGCVGFLTTVSPESLAALPPGRNRDVFLDKGDFPLLIEQVGVLPEHQNRGIGRALLDTAIENAPVSRLVATLVHAPVCNQRSLRFFSKQHGWRLWKEVTTSRRQWGFYEYRRTG